MFNERSENRRLELAVDGWSMATVDLDATLPGEMVGAVVEVEGGGALVEQQAFHPSGNSGAACANATSDTWYLADGFTVDGSLDQIVLANPYDQTVVASTRVRHREGSRAPGSYSGLTVPAQYRVIDLGAPGARAGRADPRRQRDLDARATGRSDARSASSAAAGWARR